jgi:hypothetical protein
MKAIKKDYGYDIEGDGKPSSRLYPCNTIQTIRILRARIQSDGGYPSIHGVAYMPVAVVDYSEDGISNYWSPRTNFSNVSFSKRETAQKWIEKTDQELGDVSINRGSHDISAHISMDLRTRNFDEIYELIKTRQLTSLEFDIYFKPPEQRTEHSDKTELYQLCREVSIDEGRYLIAQPPVYAVESMEFPKGEVENIRFTTDPIKLTQEAWGYWAMNGDGYDEKHDSFEALLKEESKTTSKFSSLSFFEICVVSFLGLMVLLQFI